MLMTFPKFFVSTLCSVIFLAACSQDPDNGVSKPEYKIENQQVINPTLFNGEYLGQGFGYVIYGSDGTLLMSQDTYRWQQASLPDVSAAIYDIALNPSSGTLIAVGSKARILILKKGSANWQSLESSSDYSLTRIVFDASAQCWVAAGENGLALKSCDEGETWHLIEGLPPQSISDVVVHDGDSGAWLVAGGPYFMVSDNQGKDWQLLVNEADSAERAITGLHPIQGEASVLVTYNDASVAMYREGKLMHQPLDDEPAYLTSFAQGKEHWVISGSAGSVYVSTDKGRSWNTQKIDSRYLSRVVWLEESERFMVSGSEGALAISDKALSAWTPLNMERAGNIEALLPMQQGKSVAIFGEGGMFHTLNVDSQSLETLRDNMVGFVQDVRWLPSGRIVAVGSEGFVVYSDDEGSTWQHAEAQSGEADYFFSLAQLKQSQSLIAVGPGGSIIRSTDNGTSWQFAFKAASVEEGYFHKVIADQKRNLLVAVASPGKFRISKDGGKSWQASNADTDRHLFNAAINENTGRMIAVGNGGHVLASEDGEHWENLEFNTNADLRAIHFDETTNRWLIAGGNNIWLSDNDGVSWKVIELKLTGSIFHITQSESVIAASGSNGLLVISQDSGKSWRSVTTGIDDNLRAPVVCGEKNIIIPTRRGRLLISKNAGSNWDLFSSGTRASLKTAVCKPNSSRLVITGERILQKMNIDL